MSKWWDPVITFTGLLLVFSCMQFREATGHSVLLGLLAPEFCCCVSSTDIICVARVIPHPWCCWMVSVCDAGTSTYGFNPKNGRINRHIDTWDSIQNQQYFSFEAFGDFFKQLLQTYTTPALGTPTYTLLK